MDSKKTLILKDVLAYLSQGLIIPENNRLIGTEDESSTITGKCNDYIDNICHVCLRGSIIYSALMKDRETFKDKDFQSYNYDAKLDDIIHFSNVEEYLVKENIFTFKEFMILEYIFENYWYDHAYKEFSPDERDILSDAMYLLAHYHVTGKLEIIIKAAIECGESITVNNIYKNIKNLTK